MLGNRITKCIIGRYGSGSLPHHFAGMSWLNLGLIHQLASSITPTVGSPEGTIQNIYHT